MIDMQRFKDLLAQFELRVMEYGDIFEEGDEAATYGAKRRVEVARDALLGFVEAADLRVVAEPKYSPLSFAGGADPFDTRS